jgi:hypothetical protein
MAAFPGGGWPCVKWQSEAMCRRFEAARDFAILFPVSETFDDWGGYSQIMRGLRKGWTAGLRADYLHVTDLEIADDPERQSRWRIAANLKY